MMERVLQAQQAKLNCPNNEEIWYTGYTSASQKRKPGIFQMRLTPTEKNKLEEVKNAIDGKKINSPVGILTKTAALRLYQDWAVLKRKEQTAYLLAQCPDNYFVIRTFEQLLLFSTQLNQEKIIALDTETDGVEVFGSSRMIGLSITLPVQNQHVYIPFGHHAPQQIPEAQIWSLLRPCLESEDCLKVLHNAKFDIHMLYKHGIDLKGVCHDTMIAQKILNENEPSLALKTLTKTYAKYLNVDEEVYQFGDLFEVGRDIDPQIMGVYACRDTDFTWRLYEWQQTHFERMPQLAKLYREIEHPILQVCVEMEREGFHIDMPYAQIYHDRLTLEIENLKQRLEENFAEVNLNSPKQIAQKLYEEWGLPDPSKKKSVNAKILKKLAKQCPAITDLLQYREKNKLLSTYIHALPNLLGEDGKLHGQFNQVRAATGRFSSDSPNLQNLPIEARKLFIPPSGHVFVGYDFSQIEPRVLAHITQDPGLLRIYQEGKDIYTQMAVEVFQKPVSECGDGTKYRKMMKIGLLAVMYGITDFSLAESLGVDLEAAQNLIQDFYTAYPKVEQWIQEVYADLEKNQYVTTLYGRKRRFPGHKERMMSYPMQKEKNRWSETVYQVEKERRMAVNAIIQGTAADMMKRALNALQASPIGKLVATVHDEALLIVPEKTSRAELQKLAQIMVESSTLSIPLKVDMEIYRRWGEGISLENWLNEEDTHSCLPKECIPI